MQQIVSLIEVLRNPALPQFKEAQAALDQFKQNPEFALFLACIMAEGSGLGIEEHARQLAGLILKNILKTGAFQMTDQARAYIKHQLLRALQDPLSRNVRNTAGICITTVVSFINLTEWPELCPTLSMMLDGNDAHQIDGAFNSLLKICEDNAFKFSPEDLALLIPKFLGFFQSAEPSFRRCAVECLNQLILLMPATLVANIERYLQGLSSLANDPSPEVRKGVCQAIVLLLDVYVEALMPHMPSIIEFMLKATGDPEVEVSREACEFWPSYCESEWPIQELLVPYLPRLLPVLLNKMSYDEDEIAGFDDSHQDESVPDRPEDVRPLFHKSKAHGSNKDDDEDGDDGDEDEVSMWTLRKSAASGLDVVSNCFPPQQVLPVLLPELQQRLSSSDVWVRESALLALGAVANGCLDAISDHLPQLFPFLIAQLQEPTPQVRSIACWTLSRYCRWIVNQKDQDTYLKPLLEALLQRILDRHKKVQEASCSAFSMLEEEAGALLEPYLEGILRNLLSAMNKYQTRSLIILFDTIGTLADSLGRLLNKPQVVQMLMPTLMLKWDGFGGQDKQLFPFLECLTSLAQAFGPGFQDYARASFDRCLRFIEECLIAYATCDQTGLEPPDKEFVVCSLDVLSGLAEGLKSSFEVLASNTNLVPLLFLCLKDDSPDVRQSALALVGEVAKNCVSLISAALPEYLPEMTKSLNPQFPHLCNNASWAIGEIAIKVGGDVMRPYVQEISRLLILLVNDDTIRNELLENGAITLGRLGLLCPEVLAPVLEHFLSRWCIGMGLIQSREEKTSATLGLCQVIQSNTAVFSKSFGVFCYHAIGSWHFPPHAPIPNEVGTVIHQLLAGFKQAAGDTWNNYWDDLPLDLRNFLSQTFSV